jgi:metal-responsive CopG/Arc/MetJ family transcriptional regulator
MNTISLRLPNAAINETDKFAHKLNLSRTEYIRKAIILMNQQMKYTEKNQRMLDASLRTRKESMLVNKEFSEIEHDPEN